MFTFKSDLCLHCSKNCASTVVYPCKHCVVCEECSKKYEDSPFEKNCIYCRGEITKVVYLNNGRIVDFLSIKTKQENEEKIKEMEIKIKEKDKKIVDIESKYIRKIYENNQSNFVVDDFLITSLSKFAFDNVRILFLRQKLSNTYVLCKDLVRILDEFTFDKGRIEFCKFVKVKDRQNLDVLIDCFSFDEGKQDFIKFFSN